MNSAGLIVYGVAYYELEPPITCQYKIDPNAFQSAYPDTTFEPTPPVTPFERQVVLSDGQITTETLYSQTCERKDICEEKSPPDTNLVGFTIDTSSIFFIQNWIEQLDLYCMNSTYIGALGGLAFFGAALSCFFVPYLGDKYGRWGVFATTMFLQNALGPTAILCQNLSTLYVMVFYMGMGLIGRFTCGFVLLTEWFPKRH